MVQTGDIKAGLACSWRLHDLLPACSSGISLAVCPLRSFHTTTHISHHEGGCADMQVVDLEPANQHDPVLLLEARPVQRFVRSSSPSISFQESIIVPPLQLDRLTASAILAGMKAWMPSPRYRLTAYRLTDTMFHHVTLAACLQSCSHTRD